MPNEEDSAALLKKADEWIKSVRGWTNALSDEQTRNVVGKLFKIIEFQNQALKKLSLAIEEKKMKKA